MPPIPAQQEGARWSTATWGVCVVLLLASTLNYMDRQTLSVVKKDIQTEFQLSNEHYGNIEFGFGLAFATAGAPFQAPTSNHGHGLLGMERRVRNLGGHMRIGQRLGGGTTVAVSLPTQNWTQATNTAADMRLSDNRI